MNKNGLLCLGPAQKVQWILGSDGCGLRFGSVRKAEGTDLGRRGRPASQTRVDMLSREVRIQGTLGVQGFVRPEDPPHPQDSAWGYTL